MENRRLAGIGGALLLAVCTAELAAGERNDLAYTLRCLTSVARAARVESIAQAELLEVLAQPLLRLGISPDQVLEALDRNRFVGTSNPDVLSYLRQASSAGTNVSVFCNGVTLGECRRRILNALFAGQVFDAEVKRTEFVHEIENAGGTLFLSVLLENGNQGRFAYRELIRDLMRATELSVLLYTNSEVLLGEFPRI
ncbi:MAG: hypothetical protein H6617_12075 [Bdellovibrionaceae bacterium]|nr:hypothetical protein [Pseudobdellovibrionaceae bacterium]